MPVTKSQVIECFNVVRHDYFPRWDRSGRWRVLFEDQLPNGATGYCDSKSRAILFDREIFTLNEIAVMAFLIHEICHDTATAGHILRWAERMELAAKTAEKKNQRKLASLVRSHIFMECGGTIYREVVGCEWKKSESE